MINIKNTFVDRKKWINTRSSTIFPCYINSKNDQMSTNPWNQFGFVQG